MADRSVDTGMSADSPGTKPRDDDAADRRRGADAALDGTPAVFVDGRATDSHAYEDVAAAIRAALG